MSAAAARAWPPHVEGRTYQPVRRDSVPEEAAQAFYRPLRRGEPGEIIQAAKRWTVAMRKPGHRWGPLGPVALELLEAMLFKAMVWKTGQLDWSYDQLRQAIPGGRSRDAVWRGLKELGAAGFVQWIRRFRRIREEAADPEAGPQVEQISNAYRVGIPEKVRAWFSKTFKPNVRVPEDFAAAKAMKLAELARHLDAEFTQTPLGQALDRLGRSLDERKTGER